MFGMFNIPGQRYTEERGAQLSEIEQLMAMLGGRQEEERARGDMTTEQLFGEDIDRMDRTIAGEQAGTRRALSRAGMARGGDPAGTLAAGLLQLDQQGNQARGEGMMAFNRMGQQERNQARGRADQLASNLMGARQGMLGRFDRMSDNERQLEMQRNQARNQFWMDLFGTGASLAGKVI